jgi:site-specific DNA recombinase
VQEEFVERGESGTTANRPALKRMLVPAGRGRRAVRHRAQGRPASPQPGRRRGHRHGHPPSGATLVSVSENIDETPSGLLLHGIMSLIAEFYSANLGLEVKKGTIEKTKRGGTSFRAPIGYVNVREIVDGREIRTIAIDPERGPLVTAAFRLYATASYSLSELAAVLEPAASGAGQAGAALAGRSTPTASLRAAPQRLLRSVSSAMPTRSTRAGIRA